MATLTHAPDASYDTSRGSHGIFRCYEYSSVVMLVCLQTRPV